MQPTLKDVARRAAVSYNTVSEIINLGRVEKFAAPTVEKVKRAAAELGYGANHFARSLKTGKTYLVGVSGLSPVILARGFRNPYISDVYCGIGEVFTDKDFKLVFHHYTAGNELGELCDLARNRMVDGIIFVLFSHKVPSFVEYQAKYLKEAGVPFVFIHSSADRFAYPNIGWDAATAGVQGAEHLLGHGYASYGFIKPDLENERHLELLEKGYLSTMAGKGAGIAPPHLHVIAGYTEKAGYAGADAVLDAPGGPARAYFITDRGLANGIIRRFRERGVRVPGDVAVVTCGSPPNEGELHNELTFIDAGGAEKGRLASEMILSLIDAPALPGTVPSAVVGPELIVGTSCGCAPA